MKRIIKQQTLNLRSKDAEKIKQKIEAFPLSDFTARIEKSSPGMSLLTVRYDNKTGKNLIMKQLLLMLLYDLD